MKGTVSVSMKKISSLICLLIAAILYSTDRINVHLSHIAMTNVGVIGETIYINDIFTIILALIFACMGIYFLVKSRNEK